MKEKSKIKQFICGLVWNHRKTHSQIGSPEEGYSWHDYCAECGKTLSLYVQDRLTEDQRQWILKKI